MRWMILMTCSVLLMSFSGSAPAEQHEPDKSGAEPKILNIRRISHSFPAAARRNNVSGDVLLQFRLDDKGKARDIRVVLAEPRNVFDEAAIRMVATMRFSLPPEWVASHPKRLLELAVVYLANRCGHGDPFPGIHTITMTAWNVTRPGTASEKDECEAEPAAASRNRVPTQKGVPSPSASGASSSALSSS